MTATESNNTNATANGSSDSLSDDAMTERTIAILKLVHHGSRIIADAKIFVGLAIDTYRQYAAFQAAARTTVQAESGAAELAAAGE